MCDALMFSELAANCFPLTLVNPQSQEDVFFPLRNFMDDTTGISGGVGSASTAYPSISSGYQASAIAASFLSIANNTSKTKILSTNPNALPKGIKLIQLSGPRLTSEVVHITTTPAKDLGKMQDFNPDGVIDSKEATERAKVSSIVTAFRQRATTAKTESRVFREAVTLKVHGFVQNHIRAMLPTARSMHTLVDFPIVTTQLQQISVTSPNSPQLTLLSGLPRNYGGLGPRNACTLAAVAAGAEPAAITHGRNKSLQTAMLHGIKHHHQGIADRLLRWHTNTKTQIHIGKPPTSPPSGTIAIHDPVPPQAQHERLQVGGVDPSFSTTTACGSISSDIMTSMGVTESDILNATACSIRFPNLLLRVCRPSEVKLNTFNEVISVCIEPKNPDAQTTVQDTVEFGSKDIKSQWISTTRSTAAALRLHANNRDRRNQNQSIIVLLDDRQCHIAHDLSTEAGRASAGLSTHSRSDYLAATYSEVLLDDIQITSTTDTAILDFFNIDEIIGANTIEQVNPRSTTNALLQLPAPSIAALAERLEIAKNKLRADPSWRNARSHDIILVSDASVLQTASNPRNHNDTDEQHDLFLKQQEAMTAVIETQNARLANETTVKQTTIQALHTNPQQCHLCLAYVYITTNANPTTWQWQLMAIVRAGQKNEITIAKLSTTITATTTVTPLNLQATPLDGHKHNVRAAPSTQTLIWTPATHQPVVWQTQRSAAGQFNLQQKAITLTKPPPDALQTITTNFNSMHDHYRNGHCATWATFSTSQPHAKLLRNTFGAHTTLHERPPVLMPMYDSHLHNATLTLDDCIIFGVSPPTNPRSYSLALAWANQQTPDTTTTPTAPQITGHNHPQAQPTSSACTCFTTNSRTTSNTTCSIKHLPSTTPDSNAQSPPTWQPNTTEDGKPPPEQFTCTCGARFDSEIDLNVHRFTVQSSDQPHQRCASELPAAGGAFVAIDSYSLRPLVATAIDATTSGCDISNSTQAETLTALFGLLTLLHLDLKDKVVRTYCDNSAMDLRTAKIQNEFASIRQAIKMTQFALSSSYSDHNALLATRCLELLHSWRGAEHNLHATSDRHLADIANMLADYYAGKAAEASSRYLGIIPQHFDIPQLNRQPHELHVHGSTCSMSPGAILTLATHSQTLAELSRETPGYLDNHHPQRSQHCRHAQAGHIDFKVFEEAKKQSRSALIDAVDRHILDTCKCTTAYIVSILPPEATAIAKAVLKHCSPPPPHPSTAGPACLLCGEHYEDSTNLARQTRHYTHECRQFTHLRRWRNDRISCILMQSGASFHSNKEAAVGFHTTDESCAPLFLNASDAIYDSDDRLRLGTNDHRFHPDTAKANWQNVCHGYPSIPFWRCRQQTITRAAFVHSLGVVGCNVVRQGAAIKSTQPHPALLKHLATMFKLARQEDATPFNCTSGIFTAQPCITASYRGTWATDPKNCGFHLPKDTKTALPMSAFLSIQTSSDNWKARLAQAGNTVKNDPTITVVCMVMFDGEEGSATYHRICAEVGGTTIMQCPANTLTVVGPTGFKENVDPNERTRTSADYRQPGHKVKTSTPHKVSYVLHNDKQLLGPTEGGAETNKRHFHSACQHDIVFVVFTAQSSTELFQQHHHHLPTLCQCLADTNPPDIRLFARRHIQWVCHTNVTLAASLMLQTMSPAKLCLSNLIETNACFIKTDAYYANHIKFGFTSKRSVNHVATLGTSINDARTILAAIAVLDMAYLERLEAHGRLLVFNKLINAGVPIDTDGKIINHTKCPNPACNFKTTLLFSPTSPTPPTTQPGTCLLCASATQACEPSPRRASARQTILQAASPTLPQSAPTPPRARGRMLRRELSDAPSHGRSSDDDPDHHPPLLRRTSSTSSTSSTTPLTTTSKEHSYKMFQQTVLATSANGTPITPCVQIGNTMQQNSTKYTVHSCRLGHDDIIYTLDQLEQGSDSIRVSIEVNARNLHHDIHHTSTTKTPTSWSFVKQTRLKPTTTTTPLRPPSGKKTPCAPPPTPPTPTTTDGTTNTTPPITRPTPSTKRRPTNHPQPSSTKKSKPPPKTPKGQNPRPSGKAKHKRHRRHR